MPLELQAGHWGLALPWGWRASQAREVPKQGASGEALVHPAVLRRPGHPPPGRVSLTQNALGQLLSSGALWVGKKQAVTGEAPLQAWDGGRGECPAGPDCGAGAFLRGRSEEQLEGLWGAVFTWCSHRLPGSS